MYIITEDFEEFPNCIPLKKFVTTFKANLIASDKSKMNGIDSVL